MYRKQQAPATLINAKGGGKKKKEDTLKDIVSRSPAGEEQNVLQSFELILR